MKTQSKVTLIKEMAEEERPREKLRKYGALILSNTELLAILIGKGTREMSAIMIAQSILAVEQKGISYLGDCTVSELCSLHGMGLAKSSQIIAAVELGKRLASIPVEKKINVFSPQEVAKLFTEDMRYLKKESFRVVLLNSRNEIISIEETSMGTLNCSIVHPREVFTVAIKKSAASVILVHNHPSGNPKPSSEDVRITDRLVEAGELLGIEVVDHIIIGDGTFFSLKEKMLM